MQNEEENLPPDWANRAEDLLCPLCGYNLRGLSESRCPECGFKFIWQELIEAEENRHDDLYEYGDDQNIKSFCKTYWRTSWPRRFWAELNPALPVRAARLLHYCLISLVICMACLCLPQLYGIIIRNFYLLGVIPHRKIGSYYPYFYSLARPEVSAATPWACTFIAWPWLTLFCLYLFRMSMRQANIRMVQLLRTTIYSCDFGPLVAAGFFLASAENFHVADGWMLLAAAIVCAVITTYRLTLAFRKYLRVHLPFATVLVSQVIAVLLVFIVLVQIADFSRRL